MKNNLLYKSVLASLIIFFLLSCKKDSATIDIAEKNTLHQVVRDNFGLIYFATSLHKSGVSKTLMESGPFTVIAPADEAYVYAGYRKPADVYLENSSLLGKQNQYHIIPEKINFSERPLSLNQPLLTLLGTHVYLSKMKRGPDTLATINGGKILRIDSEASNGLMQVVNRLMMPNLSKNIEDGLSANSNLTLFSYAFEASQVKLMLDQNQKYTIFAPNNAAMKRAGYQTIEIIDNTPIAELRTIVEYHIAKEQKFAQDYFLLTPYEKTTYQEKMLNNQEVSINILTTWGAPNNYTGITVKGLANQSFITPANTDILTGNGVIHIIPELLKQ